MPGWDLLDPDTRGLIDPLTLVMDQKIETTTWEVHDVDVEVVCDYVDKKIQVLSAIFTPNFTQ